MVEISIIVPVYNVEPYLRQCVDSILAQTFIDYELILVDDGSTDNSGKICDEYAQKIQKIRVIHQNNMGISAARNTGITIARGEYLCFIDSDDLISPFFCEALYLAVVQNRCMFSSCKIDRFTEDKKTDALISAHSDSKEIEIIPYFVFFERQMREIGISVCASLFRRSVFKGLDFCIGRRYEDILFAADLLGKEDCDVAYIDRNLYFYRQRAESYMNHQSLTKSCSADRVYAAEYLLERAESSGYPYYETCLDYAVRYPWFFVDPVYVDFSFSENKGFLDALQQLIRKNLKAYRNLTSFDIIQRKRMCLFARSRFLYGFNAYARLIRVYLFHIIKMDAYKDGHGI